MMTLKHRMCWQHKYCVGAGCPICPKYDDPRFTQVLGSWVIPRGTRSCKHLGEDTQSRVVCPTCSGRVELKLFTCNFKDASGSPVFGLCTRGKKVKDVACCSACEEYAQ